ncbi:MAG: PhzF family phenazine biosynthesis protein [Bauldia sp.]|nr:PhzF family phenazine biosynthesis protein [Bauldia sp.]
MPRPYAILDVFTATPLEGNGLAVVLEAEGLSGEAMQRIAREFNLSETVFVLPPDNPVHEAKLRIFTPAEELSFAGHPTVGTAVLLAIDRGRAASGDGLLILEEGVGPVRCGVSLHEGGGRARFDAPRLAAQENAAPAADRVAAALGIDTADVGFENHATSSWSMAGVGYVFVPLRNRAVVAASRPQFPAFAEVFGERIVYVYARDTVSVGRQVHARMFAPTLGISEDPATGAAAVVMASVLHRFDAHPLGSHTAIIEQGFEMGRPSLIELEFDIEADGLVAVRVGGAAVIVARGTLSI